jgi:Asp-tRNA(Asn)/Glu-tRNA(Gln) amidotransferase A subunit family amidase
VSNNISIEEITIDEIHDRYRKGSLTAESLVRAYIERIEALDRAGPKLNSVITVNPEAVEEARALDREFAATKKFHGPLHGIPVVVKDQVETKGVMTTFGSIAEDGYMPKRDASVIVQLKASGGIVLAKTNLPDFATSWFGFSSKGGETKNPYALDRDCGGSSSGTAAAVSANLGTVGIGEDTGGSIRVPASFTNLVGVRVTPGLISRTGMSPLVVFQDTAGPMARTVKDAAILLDAMVGYDAEDEYTTAYLIAGHKGSYTDNLDKNALQGARIGIVKNAFGSDDDQESAAVNKVVRAAIKEMESAGATTVEVTIPDLMEHILETSLYLTHSRHDINKFLGARPNLPVRSLEEIKAQNKYHPVLDLLEEIFKAPKDPHEDPDYFRKLAARDIFQRLVVKLVADNKLDALCFPCVQVFPPTKETVRSGKTNTLTFPTNTLIASQTWMPSICLPAGFTAEGIPVGLELVVLPYHEPDLFRLGYAFEQKTKKRRAPKLSLSS